MWSHAKKGEYAGHLGSAAMILRVQVQPTRCPGKARGLSQLHADARQTANCVSADEGQSRCSWLPCMTQAEARSQNI